MMAARHFGSQTAGPGSHADWSASPMQPTVHVIEDDNRTRTALLRLLRAEGFDANGYGSAAEFLIAYRDGVPSCIVLDVGLPGMSGVELQDALKRAGKAVPVVFLTGRGDLAMGVHAMKAGAVDFLTKPVKREALMTAIHTALARAETERSQVEQSRSLHERFEGLSPRERQVFTFVVHGRLNKQIADELGISVRTVKAHRARVMRKMEVASLAELVSAAAHLGMT